jgi:hypothetical protein
MSVRTQKKVLPRLPAGVVIHRYKEIWHGDTKFVVVTYLHHKKGGKHLQASYAGAKLNLTAVAGRQSEEMLADTFQELLREPYMSRDSKGRYVAT